MEEELEQTVAGVDFQAGLLWYNENVVMPVIAMVKDKIELLPASGSTQASSAPPASIQLSSAKLLEKQSACFNTVAVYMGGTMTKRLSLARKAYVVLIYHHCCCFDGVCDAEQ